MDTSKMELICTDDFYTYVLGREQQILDWFNEDTDLESTGEARAETIDDPRIRHFCEDVQFPEEIETFMDEYGDEEVLVIADLGLWDGRKAGGKYGKLNDMWDKLFEDSNSIYYNPENGTFVIEAVHHDGTNYFTVYLLTEEGVEYLEDDNDYKEGHQHVVNTEGLTERFEL